MAFPTTRAWSQADVTPQEKTGTKNKTVTAEETVVVQPPSVVPDETTTTPPDTNRTSLPANTEQPGKETALQTVSPPPLEDMKPTSQPGTQNTAADGTISIVIQPDNAVDSPDITKLKSTAIPIEQRSSAVSSHNDTPAASEKTTATMLLERILEPLELNQVRDDDNPRSAQLYARPLPLIEALSVREIAAGDSGLRRRIGRFLEVMPAFALQPRLKNDFNSLHQAVILTTKWYSM